MHLLQQVSWAPGLLALSALSVTHDQGSHAWSEAALTEENVRAPKEGPKTWLSLFKVQGKSPPGPAVASRGQPETIAEVADIVAANTPVFFFHNEEKYGSCLLTGSARYKEHKDSLVCYKHYLVEVTNQ